MNYTLDTMGSWWHTRGVAQDVNEIIQSLSPQRREKVEARVAELIEEEMILREVAEPPQADEG